MKVNGCAETTAALIKSVYFFKSVNDICEYISAKCFGVTDDKNKYFQNGNYSMTKEVK